MSEWRDIATAPRDGTQFQAWVFHDGFEDKTGGWETHCRYNERGEFEVWGNVEYDDEGWIGDRFFRPTHWQPLPDPPEE